MLTSETLNKAADIVEERGWVDGKTPCVGGEDAWGFDGKSPLCLEGAIAAAAETVEIGTGLLRTCPAARAVQEYLGLDPAYELWKWNDWKAKSAEEVVEVLRRAALVESVREDGANVCPTSRDHIEAVAAHEGLPVIEAGDYLYCVRRVPLLGQPIIYRASVSA